MGIRAEIYKPESVLLAPLAGYTDLAFRRACRQYGCYYAFTPLVEAGSIVHGWRRSQRNLIRGADEPWLGLQLLAADPERLSAAAERIRDLPFDVVDFNMGCPVRKVTRRGAGAAMCGSPDLAARCLGLLTEIVQSPVTAKIRVLKTDDAASTVALARKLYDAGVAALTIHGRTCEQVYSGAVAVNVIAAVREAVPIPVIANGGVYGVASANELRRATGCGRIMVARGAIGNPWIFRSLAVGRDLAPSQDELIEVLEEHIAGIVALYGEDAGMRYGRKIISSYLCGRGYPSSLRDRVTSLCTWQDFTELLQEASQREATGAPNVGARPFRMASSQTIAEIRVRELAGDGG